MPSLTGRLSLTLTVRDPVASAAWYDRVLGLGTVHQYVDAVGNPSQVCVGHPATGLLLCFVSHGENDGQRFSEFRTGLDHLEFFVPSREDLTTWAARLDARGVPHSGIKGPEWSKNAIITFRDPDNVQLELFFEGT
jgi:glyoxylase I family protein